MVLAARRDARSLAFARPARTWRRSRSRGRRRRTTSSAPSACRWSGGTWRRTSGPTGVFRGARPAGEGAQDDARSGAAGDARSRAGAADGRAYGEGRRDRRRDLRAHDGRDRARRAPGRLPGAPARDCSTWSTGTWSRPSWRKAGKPPVVRRRGGAGHRRRLGDRPRLPSSRCSPAARRWWGWTSIPTIEAMPRPAATSWACACDVTVRGGRRGRRWPRRCAAFGGLDMLILNAGIFPASRRIADLPLAEWDRVMRVNLDANLAADAPLPSAAEARAGAAAGWW